MLIGQKLATIANQNASKIVFRYLSKGTIYKDAYNYINRYSYFLQNEIKHGKKVLVYMSNCPHMAYTFFALANTKNIAVFIDPATPEIKIADKIKDLGIEAIVVSDDYVQRVRDLVKNNHLNVPIIQCESRRWGEYDTTYRLPTSMSSSDTDVVALFDTAGTTGSGKTKVVPYNHTMIQQACLVLKSIYRSGPTDNFFTYNNSLAQPFYFMHGLMFPLLSGSGIVITDLIAPEELAKELIEGKVSRVLLKTSVMVEWLTSFKNLNIKLPFLRGITRERGPISIETFKNIEEEFNVKILNIYGTAETCFAIAARQFEEPEPCDSVGKILAGVKSRIVDENGDDAPSNKAQRGQLIVSGPCVATNYYENKEASKMSMRAGWFFTGDYVEVAKNDVVRFLDRKDNLCRVIEHTIIPSELEKKLAACPGVQSIAILSLKDVVGKQQLTAIIAKQKGVEISASSFQEYCKAHDIAENERPKAIAFVDEMPLDAFGEINKYKLRFDFGS
jgi:long-chain acyl-CoA synthetase